MIRKIFFLSTFSLALASVFDEKTVILEKFDNTCNMTTKMYYKDLVMKVENNKLFTSYKAVVLENINSQIQYNIEVDKCLRKNNQTKCETFTSYRSNKYCQMVQSNSPMWKSLYGSYTPKWRCPLKKGTYVSKNSTLDITTFLVLPFDPREFWHTKIWLTDLSTNDYVMCSESEVRIGRK